MSAPPSTFHDDSFKIVRSSEAGAAARPRLLFVLCFMFNPHHMSDRRVRWDGAQAMNPIGGRLRRYARMNVVPDAGQLSQVMSQATAPAFVLGAVAAFVAVLLNRMTSVIERIRSRNEIADGDTARAHLKSDIPRLRQRAKLLNSATHLALLSGMCTALLLVGFASALFRLPHEYGARVLFGIALILLACSIFRFGQEVRIGLSRSQPCPFVRRRSIFSVSLRPL
jgi:Protein of unknown function (DUF2721)